MFSKYYDNAKLVSGAKKWEIGEVDKIIITHEDGTTEFAKGTIGGVPPFHKFNFDGDDRFRMNKTFADGGTFICESENCYAIIPGAFRAGDTPNKMQPTRFEIGGEGSLQSLVHTLVIPKTIRKISCDTLTPEDKPLIDEMKELGVKSVNILVEGEEDLMGSLKWQLNLNGMVVIDGIEVSMELTPEDMSKIPIGECIPPIENFRKYKENGKLPENIMRSLRQTFHRYGHYSVTGLHLHNFIGDFITRAHDEAENKYVGDFKNVHVDDVMGFIYNS